MPASKKEFRRRPRPVAMSGGAETAMKLFTYATSPYARKARMVLEYKGLGCETAERCYSLDRLEDLRQASDRAEVPVLVLEDGRVIADSTTICAFLDEAYPDPSVVPDSPFERARMRTIEELCDRNFDAVLFGYFLATLRESAPEAPAMKDAAGKEFAQLLGRLERELGTRHFFCEGPTPTIADFAAICYVPAARALGIKLADFPALDAWCKRMRAMPIVQADGERLHEAMAHQSIASEFEGPDGRIHWRDSRLEWPVRHGFIDFVAREFHAGKMMFPPDAS
ncbi:MAG TPA: glutathione S-transferase family protein [Candidatus Binataceae bacterium]|nr:glutathione S-transferase family protein [Candidatus Binataceae bacterium]